MNRWIEPSLGCVRSKVKPIHGLVIYWDVIIKVRYTLSLIILVFSNTLFAYEISLITGLHVSHLFENHYVDYREDAVSTGELQDGMWLAEYETKSLNDGSPERNKLLGLYVRHHNYSATLLSYKNSFYERSYGVIINRVFQFPADIQLEAGAMLVTGYRPALVNTDRNASVNSRPMLVPMVSIAYKLNDEFSLSYTNLTMNVAVFSLQIHLSDMTWQFDDWPGI